MDELSRVRAERQPPVSQTQHGRGGVSDASAHTLRDLNEGAMVRALQTGFEEIIASQRQHPSAATTVPTENTTESSEDESLTIISTPSTPSAASRRSSRSRSRSPGRRSGRSTLLGSTTLTLLTLFTFLLAFVSPTFATPASLNPVSSPLYPRSDAVVPRQNSRHLHLCKCTCFQTNSTLVPLYSPIDPAKPCTTCTRQFCLDQGLEMCKGAKLEHTDHDTGTGFEGDVWAKCFERDGFKDQGIITLYILVVVGLVVAAGLRGRMDGWVAEYGRLGPQGLYQAARGAPWQRSRSGR